MTLTPEQKDIIDKYVKKPEWRVAGKRADFNAIGERFGVRGLSRTEESPGRKP